VNVRVRLFAVARQAAGEEAVELALPEGATVADIRRQLAAHVPLLSAMLPRMLIAVNAQYAGDETIVPANADVACIPPVSGG
jgi:molybdopterin synthase catalytic subunit/molybdopterin synthase sulfur carrier subunit